MLRLVRLTGAVFLDAEFTAPWCTRSSGVAVQRAASPARRDLPFTAETVQKFAGEARTPAQRHLWSSFRAE